MSARDGDPGEEGAGGGAIPVDLGGEFGHVPEAPFGAQKLKPLHRDLTPLPERTLAQHVHLQPWIGRLFDGGPQAVVGHRRMEVGRASGGDPRRVDAEARRGGGRPRQVERGETQRTPEPLARHDPARGEVRRSQAGVGSGDLAGGQQGADGGAADRFAVEVDARGAEDVQPEPPPFGDEGAHVPFPAASKAEILSDVHGHQARQVPPQPRQELTGRERRERGVESLRDDRIHPEAQQRRGLRVGALQERRRAIGTEHGARVRPEGQHAGESAVTAGRLHGGIDHGPVAEVDAIEHPDRKVQRPRGEAGGGEAFDSGRQLHGRGAEVFSHSTRLEAERAETLPWQR